MKKTSRLRRILSLPKVPKKFGGGQLAVTNGKQLLQIAEKEMDAHIVPTKKHWLALMI